jgi:hypothetical protein
VPDSERFEKKWQSTSDTQKVLFFIKLNEIEKMAVRYDRLKSILNAERSSSIIDDSRFSKESKMLIFYHILAISIFAILFYNITNTNYIILITLIYQATLGFLIYCAHLDEHHFEKNKNALRYNQQQEMLDIESYFMWHTEISVNEIQLLGYSDHSYKNLISYVRCDSNFRYNLLKECEKFCLAGHEDSPA